MSTTGEPFGLFWDSESGDRTYSASSFEYWLKKFFTSGVFNGELQVQATSGMTLQVGAGYTNVDGKVKFWNAPFTVTLDAANSTYPRIDTIVITRDNTNRQIICEKVTGAYAGDSPEPTAPVRNAETYQLVLAQIYVPAGATEIIQSNITDTRPDPDLCGYIAGTVTEMDFSQFSAQFADYYENFTETYEADFEQWSAAQQAAFAGWMANEKNDFDTWFANLVYVLDGDVAGHLQNEIDDLRDNSSGSIFKIHTTESTLIGETVTATGTVLTKTATFDSNGDATIIGFTDVGTITFTATDGDTTATSVLSVPYFGNYSLNMAFWAATVNIQGDENLYGATVTVTDSDSQTVGTVTLSSLDGTGTFIATAPDTYTFSVTFGGNTYSESKQVTTDGATYSVELETTIDLTVDVYSAASDTVSYVGVDSQTHTITTSSSGHASATITINASGSTLIFTSSVAENLTDLTSAYSKSITLTSGTTSIYVMPDETLYWYGYSPCTISATDYRNTTFSTDIKKAPSVTLNTNDLYVEFSGATTSTSTSGTVFIEGFTPTSQNLSKMNCLIDSAYATTSNSAAEISLVIPQSKVDGYSSTVIERIARCTSSNKTVSVAESIIQGNYNNESYAGILGRIATQSTATTYVYIKALWLE